MYGWDLPERVELREVGPRAALTAGGVRLRPDDQVALVNRLTRTGLARIEVTACLDGADDADAERVMAEIERKPGVSYSVLVSNVRQADRAFRMQPDAITMFVSASETGNLRSVGARISESLAGFSQICDMARGEGVIVSAIIGNAFGCAYEGRVPRSAVIDLAFRLQGLGIVEITLGDTVGVANPLQASEMVRSVRMNLPMVHLGVYYRDTRGTALANLVASVLAGAVRFDTAVGGVGGAPFEAGGDGATLATEEAVYCLQEMGLRTGIELTRMLEAAQVLETAAGRRLPSKLYQAGGRLVPEFGEAAGG